MDNNLELFPNILSETEQSIILLTTANPFIQFLENADPQSNASLYVSSPLLNRRRRSTN